MFAIVMLCLACVFVPGAVEGRSIRNRLICGIIAALLFMGFVFEVTSVPAQPKALDIARYK